MASPSGNESQVGWKYGTRYTTYGESVRQGPVNNFFRFKTMSGVNAKRTYASVENMDPSNQKQKGRPVQSVITPKFDLQPNVNDLLRLIAHFCAKDPTISTPSGGTSSRQWVNTPFENGDTPPVSHIDHLCMEATDNDGYPVFIDNVKLQEIALKIDANKIVDCQLSFLAARDTYTSDANQLAVGTYTGKPQIRGHWAQALAASTLKVKVTAVAGGGFDGTVKWTTATYAGATTMQIVFDKWYKLTLDDATRLGISFDEDVEFCFPSSSATTLAANDEWSFLSQRVVAVASYPTLDPLIAAGLELTVAGSTSYVRSAEVKLSRGLKANFVAGMKGALSVQKSGPYMATVSIDRDRDDRDYLKRIISGEAFAVVASLYGNRIEAAIDEKVSISLPNCQVTDDQRDVTTPNTLPEKIEAQAHRSGSTDIFTITSVGTLTAL